MASSGPWPAAVRPAWVICLACLIFPWLNPYASGPSSSVDPWLVSALCIAVVYAFLRPGRLHAYAEIGLAGLAAWGVLRTGAAPETISLAAACLLILMSAGFTAAIRPDADLIHAAALAWLLAAAASTAIGLCQYFGVAEHLGSWVNASTGGEAFANLRQRNQFATHTVIGMAALFWLVPRGVPRWCAIAAICWLAIGNASTTSRTGLVQLLMVGLLACLWPGARRQRAILWSAALVAYAVAALALPWLLEWTTGVSGNRLWERVASVDVCSSRTVLWSNVLQLIAEKPWLGWGWGELDYAHYATLYGGPRFCDILDNAHNLPLHLAVELGVPAALLLCGGLLWAIVNAHPWSEADAARQMAWAVLAVIGVHSLLEYPLWYGPFQIAFGLSLGLLWPAREKTESVDAAASGYSPAAIGLAACVVAACLYAGWDYRRVSQIYLAPEARAPEYQDDPLPKIRKSWLFGNQATFAELTITPLSAANAQWTFEISLAMLHYSPEPRVIEKVIESATMLGRDDDALLHLALFRVAFPDAHAAWAKGKH